MIFYLLLYLLHSQNINRSINNAYAEIIFKYPSTYLVILVKSSAIEEFKIYDLFFKRIEEFIKIHLS